METPSRPQWIWWIYACGFLGLILANKLGESSCWFYSDARGEYSFSELFTNVLYLATTFVLLNAAWKRHNAWLILPAIVSTFFMLEEANYGQIFWDSGGTALFENEEQAALHTKYLREMKVSDSMDAAEFLSLAIQGFFTAAIPTGLFFLLRKRIPLLYLITPFFILVLCHLGKWNALLVPLSCGWDAFEEMTETLIAGTALFWSLLYLSYGLANSPESRESGNPENAEQT